MTNRPTMPALAWPCRGPLADASGRLSRTSRVPPVVGAPNKANPGRGGFGIDYGLRIIDELRSEASRARVRQTNPICHSEIPPLRPSASGRNDTREAPEPPAPNKANLSPDRRTGGGGRMRQTNPISVGAVGREAGPGAPNKPNFAGGIRSCGASGEAGAVRQTKPISGWRRETGGRSGSSYSLQLPVFGLENAKQSQFWPRRPRH